MDVIVPSGNTPQSGMRLDEKLWGRDSCSNSTPSSQAPGTGSQHIPVGTWRHCSSPQRWQRAQDALRLSLQTVSQWLWSVEKE